MGWREKFDVLREKVKADEKFWGYCDLHNPASVTFIQAVQEKYPFVSEEYLDFLRNTDGCTLNIWFFMGSGAPHFIPEWVFDPSGCRCPALFGEAQALSESLPKWRNVAELGLYLPIGRDGCAETYFLMLEDGQILEIDCETKKTSWDRIIANSFGELLDNVIIGEKYYTLGCDDPGDWSPYNENDWTRFLNEQGWWVH
ncbi:SMI1/KNR4 family protein [Symmachiella dynata]|uniref:SMI1/KNR4 family protein n=1 Tax=Symmachiella dynata TaxID=2527995 RepID=UPI0030EF6FF3